MTLWSPRAHFLHDPTLIEHHGVFHLFFEATTIEPVPGVPRGPVTVCHYTSKDLENWEELPCCFDVGPAGSWDGYLIYHMDVIVHQNKFYMFYTGLDVAGQGQRQQVGLAISDDGVHFTKHPGNPILSNQDYERWIPQEASYRSNNRDFKREWFRDPVVVWDESGKQWVLVIMARDERFPLDTRACIAGYTSTDLIHWKNHGPVFSPNRFHTLETPSIFEHQGRWFLVYMSHPIWGVPFTTTDPYQCWGDFIAVSDSGPLGPYRSMTDEILLATADTMRAGAQRILKCADGRLLHYTWLAATPGPTDGPARPHFPNRVLPPIKPVTISDDLRVSIGVPETVTRITPTPIDGSQLKPMGQPQRPAGPNAIKCYTGLSGNVFKLPSDNAAITTRVQLHAGHRAGLLVRYNPATGEGLLAWLDHRHKRVCLSMMAGASAPPDGSTPAPAEDTTYDAPPAAGQVTPGGYIDARGWEPTPDAQLTVVLDGPVIDVYVDGRLMIEQVRHRESGRHAGLVVDAAHATFDPPTVRAMP